MLQFLTITLVDTDNQFGRKNLKYLLFVRNVAVNYVNLKNSGYTFYQSMMLFLSE